MRHNPIQGGDIKRHREVVIEVFVVAQYDCQIIVIGNHSQLSVKVRKRASVIFPQCVFESEIISTQNTFETIKHF